VRLGKSPARHFNVWKRAAPELSEQGRAFVLQGDRLGSLSAGAPVFYREVKVGAVRRVGWPTIDRCARAHHVDRPTSIGAD